MFLCGLDFRGGLVVCEGVAREREYVFALDVRRTELYCFIGNETLAHLDNSSKDKNNSDGQIRPF